MAGVLGKNRDEIKFIGDKEIAYCPPVLHSLFPAGIWIDNYQPLLLRAVAHSPDDLPVNIQKKNHHLILLISKKKRTLILIINEILSLLQSVKMEE